MDDGTAVLFISFRSSVAFDRTASRELRGEHISQTVPVRLPPTERHTPGHDNGQFHGVHTFDLMSSIFGCSTVVDSGADDYMIIRPFVHSYSFYR